MVSSSPTTYGLLGMLAVRSWTGYELTRQMHRSLRFVWSSSEGHLYREQKRLVELGWATVETEPSGGRSRNRYTITPAGEAALRDWLATVPQEPHFEIEGLLRLFLGDRGTVEDMATSMEATANAARSMLDELLGFVDEYLAEGGPLWMLEHDVGGPGGERVEFQGRPMFPERLHVVALVIDATTRLLAVLETFARNTARELRTWHGMSDRRTRPRRRPGCTRSGPVSGRKPDACNARNASTRLLALRVRSGSVEEDRVHVAKDQIPVKISAPGAVARQLPDFGVADGTIGAEYFTLDAGTDLAPLLAGLDGDACHSAHWGYVVTGDVIVTYRDRTNETCTAGDAFHWPPGHSVRIERDAELILFSPQVEHTAVMDHILDKLAAVEG